MRYILFAGHNYYPCGGMRDMVFEADTMDECQRYFADHARDIARCNDISNWGQIVERSTLKVVLYGKREPFAGALTDTWKAKHDTDL